MKIDFSRYTAFVSNPERYRLRYVLNLVPENDEVPTFLNYGRRRGTCTHDILDHRATGAGVNEIRGKYPSDLFERCEKIADMLPNLPAPVVSEKEFDIPIFEGSRHSIIGRIDRIYVINGKPMVRDFKTSKKRTKKETEQYLGELSTSFQVPFYLAAAKTWGYATEDFTFDVLVDEKDKPSHIPLPVTCGEAEVERRMRHVRAACYAIEGLLRDIGPEYPWPHSNAWPCCGDKLFCGYGEICGRRIPVGCIPTGFVPRVEHLAQYAESEKKADE